MPRVVTSSCDHCKFTDCVTVCPADCFREGPTMLYIDPASCIDCDACVPQCPVGAIFEESAVPEPEKRYIQLNAEMAAKLPPLTTKKEALPTAAAKKAELEAKAAAAGGAAPGAGGAAVKAGPSPAEIAAKRKREADEKRRKEEERARFERERKERVGSFVRRALGANQDELESPEDVLDRDRRYGRVYWLEEAGGGRLRLHFELPLTLPRSLWRDPKAPDRMPDYRWKAELSAASTLVVEGWLEDPQAVPLVGRAGSFPPGFRREIPLPRPMARCEARCADKVLTVDLTPAGR